MLKALGIDYRQILTKAALEANSMGKTPLKYAGKVVEMMAGINLSIRTKILLSLCIVILMMGMTNAVLMVQVLNYSRQYDAIINNITTANSISGHIKPDIDTAMWNIVAGRKEFAEGKQYEIISGVNNKLQWMSDHASFCGIQDQVRGHQADDENADPLC